MYKQYSSIHDRTVYSTVHVLYVYQYSTVYCTVLYSVHSPIIINQHFYFDELANLKVLQTNKPHMAAEIDKWIEISRDCKYLPENDLKVLKLLILQNFVDRKCFFITRHECILLLSIPNQCFY